MLHPGRVSVKCLQLLSADGRWVSTWGRGFYWNRDGRGVDKDQWRDQMVRWARQPESRQGTPETTNEINCACLTAINTKFILVLIHKWHQKPSCQVLQGGAKWALIQAHNQPYIPTLQHSTFSIQHSTFPTKLLATQLPKAPHLITGICIPSPPSFTLSSLISPPSSCH